MIEFIKAIYCIYYESICKALKKQDKLEDYKIDDGFAINQEGELIGIINVKVVPKTTAKHIKMKITLTLNDF